MHKRKVIVISSDDDLDIPLRATASERSLQTARRRGKKVSEVTNESDGMEGGPLKSVKKPKFAPEPSACDKAGPSTSSVSNKQTGEMDGEVSEHGDTFVDLGRKRRATVRTFKGVGYVDVREFWGDEGNLQPGKKGIMLSQEQWETLKRHTNTIDSFIAEVDK